MSDYELVPCKKSEYNKSLTLGMWIRGKSTPTGYLTEHLLVVGGQNRVVLRKIYHKADKINGISARWECYKMAEIPKHSYLYGI